MGFIDKRLEAYREGLNVGRCLMQAAMNEAFWDENASLDEQSEREYFAMQMLCAVGGLQALMQPTDYVAMLPIFFRTVCADIPAVLFYRSQQPNTACTDSFALGVSVYINDNLEEWDEWLLDNGFIDEDEFETRVDAECVIGDEEDEE